MRSVQFLALKSAGSQLPTPSIPRIYWVLLGSLCRQHTHTHKYMLILLWPKYDRDTVSTDITYRYDIQLLTQAAVYTDGTQVILGTRVWLVAVRWPCSSLVCWFLPSLSSGLWGRQSPWTSWWQELFRVWWGSDACSGKTRPCSLNPMASGCHPRETEEP